MKQSQIRITKEHPEADPRHIVKSIVQKGLQPVQPKASISLRIDDRVVILDDSRWRPVRVQRVFVYAYDLKAGEKWRVRGKFLAIVDGDSHLWAFRKDNVLVQVDRSTGKVISEHPTLWRPSGFRVVGNCFYAFTADGLAYALTVGGSDLP